MRQILNEYRKFKPFSEEEAWLLFRLAAFAEAAGWSLLIGGILIKRYLTPGSDLSVLITGQIHGTFFLLYMVAAIILSPSLGWSNKQALFSTICGVPPYGSLFLEAVTAHQRSLSRLHRLELLTFYRMLSAKLSTS